MDCWYDPLYLRARPDEYFIFGDNTQRIGKGGQAKIRHEPNAIGICTKWAPGWDCSAYYWQESEYLEHIKILKEDFKKVWDLLEQGKTVWWPQDGIGTGLAELRSNAPLTLRAIEDIRDTLLKEFP